MSGSYQSDKTTETGKINNEYNTKTYVDMILKNVNLLKFNPIALSLSINGQTEIIAQLRTIDQPMLNYEAVISSAIEGSNFRDISETVQDNLFAANRLSVNLTWPTAQDKWLDIAVDHDFSDDFEPISNVTSVVDNPASVAQRQVAIICEFCGYRPNMKEFTDLCIIHTYLCTYFNILDSYIDRHAENDFTFLDGGPLLVALVDRIHVLTKSMSGNIFQLILQRLKSALELQRLSLLEEAGFRKHPFVIAENEERDSIIGKACCYLFIYDFVSDLSGNNKSGRIRSGIEEYLFLSQLADDLGDWREDYRQKNFTSFLRGCFKYIGCIPDENILEEKIYMEGLYENRLAMIIRGMDILASGLTNPHALRAQQSMKHLQKSAKRFPLAHFTISQERQRLYEIFFKFIETKVIYLSHKK